MNNSVNNIVKIAPTRNRNNLVHPMNASPPAVEQVQEQEQEQEELLLPEPQPQLQPEQNEGQELQQLPNNELNEYAQLQPYIVAMMRLCDWIIEQLTDNEGVSYVLTILSYYFFLVFGYYAVVEAINLLLNEILWRAGLLICGAYAFLSFYALQPKDLAMVICDKVRAFRNMLQNLVDRPNALH
ncbi:hypothetical protein KR018_011162 [Drosophila ironensis]|nr:hypothetical protein KR018_011162 [Drosophila ironensis]